MQKKTKLTIIVIILILAGAGVFGFLVWQKNEIKKQEQAKIQQEEVKKEDQKTQQNTEVDMSDWKKYRNEEYGFEINLPGDINKWSVEKKVFPKKNNISDIEAITLYFKYELNQTIPRAENDPSLGRMSDMDLWYMDITPINNWKQDKCKNVEGPCRQGKVLGKSDIYVFESGYPSIEGAGYLCGSPSSKLQNEFCSVDKEIDSYSRNIEKLKFKIITN